MKKLFYLQIVWLVLTSTNAFSYKNYEIDDSIVSNQRDSRIRHLVMHYTEVSLERSIELLTKKSSAHYLVPQVPQANSSVFKIYQLVPESERAWHAGHSHWQKEAMLNASSIGIEMVHFGFEKTDLFSEEPGPDKWPAIERNWIAYSENQFKAVAELAKDIVTRYQIVPFRVVGHSDISPDRKVDPGPLFPWKRLYDEYQIGAWPDPKTVALYAKNIPYDGNILKLQKKLARYGYSIKESGQLDPATRMVLSAFQMHFRPTKNTDAPGYDGQPDIETVAILDGLLNKYFDINPMLFESQ